MKKKKYYLIGSSLLAASLTVTAWAADKETTESDTVYPAVYEAAFLEAVEGLNSEVVVGSVPGVDGYFGYTTNDSGVELWVAEDNTALAWEVLDTNPLSEYNCQRVGRHSLIVFKGETYFAASCEAGNFIFRQTDLTTAEIVHTNTVSPASIAVDDPVPPPGDEPGEEPENPGNSSGGYPTAGIVGLGDDATLAMFANGLVSLSNDGDTWTDHTSSIDPLPGLPTGVPLEASQVDADGTIYLPFTSGEVMSFDGSAFVLIGEDYLDGTGENKNLPAIGVNGNMLYVGNQDMTNGASIFAYDLTAEDPEWEEIVQLDTDDTIVNKMGLSATFGSNDRQYLIFYTSNGTVGTGVYSINSDNVVERLLPEGLGGGANEREVVSITNKTITDNGTKKKVLLFGTQNTTDGARIYVMQLDENLPVEPTTETTILSEPEEVVAAILAKSKYTTAFGEPFKLKVSNKVITKGDRLTLYVNDEMVDKVLVKDVKNTVLKWKGASKKKVGSTFTVSVGRKPVYGSGDNKQLSSNIVTGESMKVKVVK